MQVYAIQFAMLCACKKKNVCGRGEYWRSGYCVLRISTLLDLYCKPGSEPKRSDLIPFYARLAPFRAKGKRFDSVTNIAVIASMLASPREFAFPFPIFLVFLVISFVRRSYQSSIKGYFGGFNHKFVKMSDSICGVALATGNEELFQKAGGLEYTVLQASCRVPAEAEARQK
jgi:hypothetical protein